MKIGYVRVSTYEHNLDQQLNALEKAGCQRIVREVSSNSIRPLPQLQRTLSELRPGDAIVVWKLDRLARSTRDLLETIDRINTAGGGFQSLSEPWANTETDAGDTIKMVFAGFAKFGRDLLRERIQHSIRMSKERGVQLGRPRKLSPDQMQLACRLLAEGEAVADVASKFNVHEATIYRLAAAL